MLDLRGTGEGTRLDCRVAPSDAPLQALVEPPFDNLDIFRTCRRELEKSADLTQYTTPIALQDLDELRRAMGYGKIYLYGGSYGSRAGLGYIQMYGANVRGAFFSGISAMENRAPLFHAAAAQRAFDRTAAQCRAEPACHAAYPDSKADLDAIRAALRRSPARVKVKDPRTGAEGELTLTEQGFGDGLRVMLYSEETGRRVPLMLKQARAGDYAPFAQAAVNSGHAFRKTLAFGLLLSVSCAEDIVRIRPEEIARETGDSFIGDHRVRGQMAACELWPKAAVPADYNKPFTSPVPVVLVSGDLDPVTPPQWGEIMKRYFPNSIHVVVPGAHVSENPCVESIAHHLFERGSLNGIDRTCVAALKNPPFVMPQGAAPQAASPST
jgi:pimeloyl-ACP methyl ester carboxylesterase